MSSFDNWSKLKQNIDSKKKAKRYNSGDVWWCSLGKNVGFEEDGKGDKFERPVLVLKDFNRHVCLIVPLTSKEKKDKFHFCLDNVDGVSAYAILSQIRLIDTKRLVNQVGFVDDVKLKLIKKAIYNLMR